MIEYKTRYFGSHNMPEYAIEKYLNDEGKDRWELVQVIINKMIHDPSEIANYTFIFKRSLIKKTKP